MTIFATIELAKQRLSACDACEYKRVSFLAVRCGACGCLLKGKVMLQSESCPKGKW